MSIETSLGAYLVANVAGCGGRVDAYKLPQNPTFPALTFFRVSGVPTYSHSGFSHYTVARYQISCWALSSGAMRQLVKEVRDALDGYAGGMGDVTIYHCFCVGDHDMSDPETKRYQAPVDFEIAFNE